MRLPPKLAGPLHHLGSPRVVMDGTGTLLERHTYLPFGEGTMSTVVETTNTREFTGHERDKETGLDYMLARYYDSSLGRFMAVDLAAESAKIQNPQSWNRYTYALNNPLRYVDPDGRVIHNSLDDPTSKETVRRAIELDPRLQEIHRRTDIHVFISNANLDRMGYGSEQGGQTNFAVLPDGSIIMRVYIDPALAAQHGGIEALVLFELSRVMLVTEDPLGMVEEYERQLGSLNPDWHFRLEDTNRIFKELNDLFKRAEENCKRIKCKEKKKEKPKEDDEGNPK